MKKECKKIRVILFNLFNRVTLLPAFSVHPSVRPSVSSSVDTTVEPHNNGYHVWKGATPKQIELLTQN